MTETTRDYAGRQLDIELLQHIESPIDQRVYPSVDHGDDGSGPRLCSGMEKVVHRYAKLLLTDLGSVKFNENEGGDLVSSVRKGEVSSKSWMSALFTEASGNAIEIMKADDADTGIYGDVPPDERISSADLVSIDISPMSSLVRTVKIHVRITTDAGSSYEFLIPVASGL